MWDSVHILLRFLDTFLSGWEDDNYFSDWRRQGRTQLFDL
jgi:hypothetical protein